MPPPRPFLTRCGHALPRKAEHLNFLLFRHSRSLTRHREEGEPTKQSTDRGANYGLLRLARNDGYSPCGMIPSSAEPFPVPAKAIPCLPLEQGIASKALGLLPEMTVSLVKAVKKDQKSAGPM
jgi:hypothetical protein